MLHRVVAVVVILASTAGASEEAHHDAAAHASGLSDLLFPTINFAIFMALIWRFAVPAIRSWVRERHDAVVRALAEAAAAKAAAERLRQEWQQRIAELDKTVTELRAQAQRDAERERDRILADAYKTAQSIQRDAERAAANEVRRVRQELRGELVQKALQLAEERTRAHWTAQDQQRSLDEFLKQVRS